MKKERQLNNAVIETLQNIYAHLAMYPEEANKVSEAILMLTADIIKSEKIKRIKKESQTSHLSECIKFFLQSFDENEKDRILLDRLSEPGQALKSINKDRVALLELIELLVRNWDRTIKGTKGVTVKTSTVTYRLLYEICNLLY